jgi:hypothetical protein
VREYREELSLDHWNQEIEELWQQVAELNQTRSRRSGQFQLEFLLMETQVNEEFLAEERARLSNKLPYDQVLDMLAQVSLRCSILVRHYHELDRACDRLLELAPDVED